MLRNLFLVAVAVAACAAPTRGQTIRLLGTVTRTGAGYGLEHTSVELVAAGVDLSRQVGRDVDLTGAPLYGHSSPRVAVATAAGADSWLRVLGNPRIGTRFTLRLDDSLASEHYTFLSLGGGFLPLDGYVPGVSGTVFLDLSSTLTVGWGFMQNSWRQEFAIPASTDLIGVRLRFQSAVMRSLGSLLYGNVTQLVIGA